MGIELSTDEIERARQWAEANQNSLPPEVYKVIQLVMALAERLNHSKQKTKGLLQTLRRTLGCTAQSEKGASLGEPSDPSPTVHDNGPEPQLPPEMAAVKEELNRLRRQLNRYLRRVKRRRKKPPSDSSPPAIALGLEAPEEKLFSGRLGDHAAEKAKMAINRMKEFKRTRSLHASEDERNRYEFGVNTKHIILQVETVTDPLTGKSVTASTDSVGPPDFQFTWKALANAIMSVMGYAIPLNRLATILQASCPYFTSARLCKMLDYGAELFLPIYLHLGESLADSAVLAGDDTPTKVLEMNGVPKGKPPPEAKKGLASRIADTFGRVSRIKSGKRNQKRLNVSLVVGKTDPNDRRSYIFFFKTHVGHFGNLLSQILGMRLIKNKELVIQSDLSSSNHPDGKLYEKFKIQHAGCGSHARRPFWRHRDQDEPLCYWMLNAFLSLEKIEDRLDELGRTEERVLYFRQKFGKKVWQAIRLRCESVIRGETLYSFRWPKTSKLYQACQYILDHYRELTLYLDDPRLWSTTNLCERLLRWEKIMLDASGFRTTERGRLNTDILRTILHTCSAAEVELHEYLYFVFQNRDQLESSPEKFTPYAFALTKKKTPETSPLTVAKTAPCPDLPAVAAH